MVEWVKPKTNINYYHWIMKPKRNKKKIILGLEITFPSIDELVKPKTDRNYYHWIDKT
jgi:predicted XRE-type DNA-binding protein